MKRRLTVFFVVVATVVAMASCKKVDPEVVYQAIATAKQTSTGGCFFAVDDSTAIIPQNQIKMDTPETRVLLLYTITGSGAPISGYKFSYAGNVNSVSQIRSKWPEESLGSEDLDAAAYGSDKVGLYFDGFFPPTMIEDGYLNVHFAYEATPGSEHYIHLVTNVDGDPYKVELRHDKNGDTQSTLTYESIIAFPLELLKDTEGKTVKLTLVWNSLASGKKESVQLDYKSRTDWPVWPDGSDEE